MHIFEIKTKVKLQNDQMVLVVYRSTSCLYFRWRTDIKLIFYVTLIFGDNFLFVILANCGRCREKLAPTSSNIFNIQDVVVNSMHRCTL